MDIALLDHGPEVVHSVRERALGCNIEPLAFSNSSGDVAGVHIATLVIFVAQDLYPVFIIRNNIFKPAKQFGYRSGSITKD